MQVGIGSWWNSEDWLGSCLLLGGWTWGVFTANLARLAQGLMMVDVRRQTSLERGQHLSADSLSKQCHAVFRTDPDGCPVCNRSGQRQSCILFRMWHSVLCNLNYPGVLPRTVR